MKTPFPVNEKGFSLLLFGLEWANGHKDRFLNFRKLKNREFSSTDDQWLGEMTN